MFSNRKKTKQTKTPKTMKKPRCKGTSKFKNSFTMSLQSSTISFYNEMFLTTNTTVLYYSPVNEASFSLFNETLKLSV